ncbi:hypothetical protein Z947_2029 [Sulfitobacter geojensis]|nr:hypothetical protein Z947_2029 [Sulfitobacter geojensis]
MRFFAHNPSVFVPPVTAAAVSGIPTGMLPALGLPAAAR